MLVEKLFKISCSSISKIMADPTKKSTLSISKGAVTHCEEWYKRQLYERRKEVFTKELEKGTKQEDIAIAYAAEVLNWGMVHKNEQRFSDGEITGEPDVILRESVEDTKCSWDCFTFPLFETEIPNKDYWWQLQGYMALTGKQRAGLVYVLVDANDRLIEQEAFYRSRYFEMDEVDSELYEKVSLELSYSYIDDPKLRIKRFEVKRDDVAIQAIRDKVHECRKYIAGLEYKINPGINV